MRPVQHRGLLLAIGLLTSLLIVNASVVYRQTRVLYADSQRVARTHEMLVGIEDLLSTVKDAETGQRGYLITGNEGYLDIYRDGLAVLDSKTSRVEQLIGQTQSGDTDADAEQQARFRRLRDQIALKRKEMAATIDVRKMLGFDAARQVVATNQGKRTMDAIRAAAFELKAREQQLLGQRERDDRNAYWWAVVSNAAVGALGIVAFGAFAGLLHRHLDSQVKSAALVHEQRQLLHATLISIGDAVIATGGDGRITFLNSIAEELTGWKDEEARGLPLETVFSIINEETRNSVANPALRALTEGKITGLANHTILRSKNGVEWPIDDSAAPIRNEDGQVVGAILVFREISERKRQEREQRLQTLALTKANQSKDELLAALKQSEERFRLAADAVAGVIYDCDPATGQVKRSPGLAGILGFRPDEVPPTIAWWFSRIHPDDCQRVISERDKMWAAGDRCANEYRIRHRDGHYLYVTDRSLAQRDAERRIIRYVGCVQDSTDIKEYERAWQEANRRKDEFLATLAHELRNPLAPLSNALELWPSLQENREQMQELRGMMYRQVQQMTRLIDDLLDVSRITRGKIQLQKELIELSRLLAGAIESVQPLIDACGHTVSVDLPAEPMFVEGDVARLNQIFGNILNNAAKYTGQDGQISVSAEPQGQNVVVRIRDNGPGIPARMLSEIFEMFRQVDQTLDRSHGGLGIGLTLVKRLVDLHQGTVKAHSEGPGKGSEFTVTLPLAASDAENSLRDQPPAAGASNKLGQLARMPVHRILVVDDIEASATTFTMLLRALGQNATSAQNGSKAIEWVLANRPDLVFLDIAMPGMNGYEVARQLRSYPHLNGLILVALTGYGQEEDRRRSKEAGFDHHLTKPVTIEALRQLFASSSVEPLRP